MTEKMAEVEEDDQLQLFDLEEVAKEAESEVVQDRENSLAEKLATMKNGNENLWILYSLNFLFNQKI